MVKTIRENECFGEVALVTKGAARAADCVASGSVVLLAMARDAFERLMGPVEEVLSEKVAEYARLNASLAASRHPTASPMITRANSLSSRRGSLQPPASQQEENGTADEL